MKILFAIVCALGVFSVATDATAQRRRASRPASSTQRTTPPAPPAKPMPVLPDIRNDPDVEAADIAIIANITAKEVRVDASPSSSVEFLDKAKNQTIWQVERFNLPDRLEPGVTYRNIGIRLKITSRLADIERIVAEALGEIPISENNEPPAPPKAIVPASASVNVQKSPAPVSVTNTQRAKP